MRCHEAQLLMMDRPEERRHSAARGFVDHLEACDACREEFARIQLLAEALGGWKDLPVGEEQQRRCVEHMARAGGERPTVYGGAWLLGRRCRIAMVAAVVALAMVCAPIGPGIPGISAEIGHAFSSIEQWKAEGTATPPLLQGPQTGVCNHFEVWFAKPNRMHVRVDDGPQGPLYALSRDGRTTVSYDPHQLVDRGLESEAAGLDVERLFAVQEWLPSMSLLDAPVRDLGLEQFGPRTVRQIEIRPRGEWLSAPQAPPLILLRVDSETMLPVLLETSLRGSVVVLDFQYGVAFPAGAELPEEAVTSP